MNKERVIEIFKQTGVLQEGHFKLSSGLHSNQYLQCAQVLQYPVYAQELAKGLAKKFSEVDIDVVVGPAMGGVTLSYAVGLALEKKTIFTEREAGKMVLRRGFRLNPGDKVLVIDDVLTTGKSVNEVIEVLDRTEANLAGVGVLVDRSAGQVDFKAPIESMLQIDVKAYQPQECPMCKEEIEFNQPGSRHLNK
ncbi:orotate phosphoribosyltransferase [Halobacteroides halobius DSM 5150]|uniref:Orotate phosphoribosyltransferase n=1 Tax=Halobacteroides halobius (strain ATCC 35273 / DSM 5150 / MD-1) TaxID=748449 RepID=L0K7A4_HALHC|nr:orotate phosphoribosyltransferase [Halobacteroides halobius]AGB40881.1 orotate phosphoribosyltransferase [Halobacteroides halobius DSM 5150]